MKNRLLTFCLLFIILAVPASALAVEINVKSFQDIPFLREGSYNIADYIDALYLMAISIASLLVVFRLMWAGVEYMLTESVIKKNDAKSKIGSALLGLVIILSAVTILETINPNLTNLKVIGEGKSVKITGDSTILDYGDLYFEPGEIFSEQKIVNYCKSFDLLYDQNCHDKYIEALEKNCYEHGGVQIINSNPRFSIERARNIYDKTCVGSET